MKKLHFSPGGFTPILLCACLFVAGVVANIFGPPSELPGYSASLQGTAKKAMTDARFEAEKGYCSKFVRQVTASEYSLKYRELFGSSALVTMAAFRRAGRGFEPAQIIAHGGLLPGDILFKGTRSGPFGHVGVYVGDDLVAENSSTSIGRVFGAKGYRTLRQFGTLDYIGRLPGNTGPRLVLAVVRGSREVYFRLPGAELRAGSFEIDRDVLAGILKTSGRADRVPLRDALDALKFRILKVGDHRRDASDPRVYVFVAAK